MRQVVRDDLLVAIAKRQPRNRRDLEALRDFNRPALLNRSQEILGVSSRPARSRRPSFPSSRRDMKSRRGSRPSPICCRRPWHSAACRTSSPARSWPTSPISSIWSAGTWAAASDSQPPALLQGWRGELCGPLLLDVLEGRLALRVVDPESEFPVAIEELRAEASRIGCNHETNR